MAHISIDENCQGEIVILSGIVADGASYGEAGYSIYNSDTILYEVFQSYDDAAGSSNYISTDTFCLIPGCYFLDVFGENINAQLYTDSIQILELQNNFNYGIHGHGICNLSSSFCVEKFIFWGVLMKVQQLQS